MTDVGYYSAHLERIASARGTAHAPADLAEGDLVWQQMYSPGRDPGEGGWPSLDDMISAGTTYKPRTLMRVRSITEDFHPDRDYTGPYDGKHHGPCGIQRWWLVDPARPNDESKWSFVESDWCVLERPTAAELADLQHSAPATERVMEVTLW